VSFANINRNLRYSQPS